jgi:hypothetical protein
MHAEFTDAKGYAAEPKGQQRKVRALCCHCGIFNCVYCCFSFIEETFSIFKTADNN